MTRQSAIGVIPGRGGSSRLPGKNVLPVAGRPLIAYTIEAARKASLLDRVIVSTDDEAIAQAALASGAELIRRPKDLARDDSPIDDAYRHVLAYLEEHERFKPEIVVGMQANVPVRKEGEIDAVVQRLAENSWATAVATARKISERPEWMKQLKNPATGEITPFMNAVAYRKQDLPDLYLLDGATIAIRTDVLKATAGNLRCHAYLGDRVLIHVHSACYAVEIDEPEDVELVEYFLKATTKRSE